MELIAEILVEIVLAVCIFLVQWCIRHKKITYAILLAALVVIDIFVLIRVFHVI